MVNSFKRSHACTATLSAPNPAAGPRQPTPPLETPGHSLASLGQSLVGSLLLSPGSWCQQGSVCALQVSVSQSCVSSGSSMAWLKVIFSKKAYAMPRSAGKQSIADPYLHRRYTSTLLFQCLWCLLVTVTQVCLSPLNISGK